MNQNEPLKERLFAFEADFATDLRCIPMAVRRKLDLAGVKLKLVQWHGLSSQERERLLRWCDSADSLSELRQWLLERSASLPQGPARAIEPVEGSAWQQSEALPELVRRSCEQLGLRLKTTGWQGLDALQRFALVKLSHPGHEHRNLPLALQEFGLLLPPAKADPGFWLQTRQHDPEGP
jgi:hypothetical protein